MHILIRTIHTHVLQWGMHCAQAGWTSDNVHKGNPASPSLGRDGVIQIVPVIALLGMYGLSIRFSAFVGKYAFIQTIHTRVRVDKDHIYTYLYIHTKLA